jgi:hypothetical protein
VPHDGYYTYVIPGGRDYLQSLVGVRVYDKEANPLQCLGTMQVLGADYNSQGVYHDVARHEDLWQGIPLSPATQEGTIVGTKFAPNGSYPNIGGGNNHVLVFFHYDGNNAILYAATKSSPITETVLTPDQQSG